MSEDDRSYFLQRAQAEAEQAARANHPDVAARHLQLAAAYHERVSTTDVHEPGDA